MSSRRWMHKIWPHCISPVINFASLTPHILYGQRTEKVAFRLQWAIDAKGRIISSKQMIQCDSVAAPQKRYERINHPNIIHRAKCKRIGHMERSLELGHRKHWHSAAEEMWLKHNSMRGHGQAKPFVCV